ncbi:hypothetical protein B0T10DRAFT_577841 [Thelonectria olida]|uniref:Uncharacterized protein n=1 Tax=Thelonectria olida TaxID=1576542 RepID=A0A9P8WFQ7_9HYPO|nr:hypothetical protein B0T10DRAFT_577841 [Thelonectria olida]
MILGTSDENAKPYIVVLCPEAQARRVRKFLAKDSAKALLKPDDDLLPQFESLIHAQAPVTKSRGGNIQVLISNQGNTAWRVRTYCGTPIIVRPPSMVVQSATLGGIIKMVDQIGKATLYGLTVDHVLADLEEDDHLEQSNSYPSPDSSDTEMDDIDDSSPLVFAEESTLHSGLPLDTVPMYHFSTDFELLGLI